MINFVSCHDGYTLVDKLKLSVQGEHSEEELVPIDKLIHTVLLTSQGIPLFVAVKKSCRTNRRAKQLQVF